MSNRWKIFRNMEFFSTGKTFILFEDKDIDFQIIEEFKPRNKDIQEDELPIQKDIVEIIEETEIKKKSGRPKKENTK